MVLGYVRSDRRVERLLTPKRCQYTSDAKSRSLASNGVRSQERTPAIPLAKLNTRVECRVLVRQRRAGIRTRSCSHFSFPVSRACRRRVAFIRERECNTNRSQKLETIGLCPPTSLFAVRASTVSPGLEQPKELLADHVSPSQNLPDMNEIASCSLHASMYASS